MSIYMVQHSFSKPEWLQEWNDWYANNLKVFMTIPGIYTAQRFQALEGSPPRFMAVYTVDPDVFESKIYLDNGGGGKASERFRPAIAFGSETCLKDFWKCLKSPWINIW